MPQVLDAAGISGWDWTRLDEGMAPPGSCRNFSRAAGVARAPNGAFPPMALPEPRERRAPQRERRGLGKHAVVYIGMSGPQDSRGGLRPRPTASWVHCSRRWQSAVACAAASPLRWRRARPITPSLLRHARWRTRWQGAVLSPGHKSSCCGRFRGSDDRPQQPLAKTPAGTPRPEPWAHRYVLIVWRLPVSMSGGEPKARLTLPAAQKSRGAESSWNTLDRARHAQRNSFGFLPAGPPPCSQQRFARDERGTASSRRSIFPPLPSPSRGAGVRRASCTAAQRSRRPALEPRPQPPERAPERLLLAGPAHPSADPAPGGLCAAQAPAPDAGWEPASHDRPQSSTAYGCASARAPVALLRSTAAECLPGAALGSDREAVSLQPSSAAHECARRGGWARLLPLTS